MTHDCPLCEYIRQLQREVNRNRAWLPSEFEAAREWCDQAISKSKDGLLTVNEMRLTNNLTHALDTLQVTRRQLINLEHEANERR